MNRKETILKQKAQLSPAKRKLLEKLLKKDITGQSASSTIPCRQQSGPVSLSFAQQRLWSLGQLVPDNPFYNLPMGIRLTGELQVPVLERSLNEIIRRHEALRTTFTMIDGQPVQVVAPVLKLVIPEVDLRQLLREEREKETLRLAVEEGRRPFNLAKAPLLRATLLRLQENEHAVLFTMHHIISDGWSMGVLIREIAVLYAAFSSGKPSPLPELKIQYPDFAVWQRQWLEEEVLEKQLTYWKQQLGGNLSILELPADRQRTAVQNFRGSMEGFNLDPGLSKKLIQLGRDTKSSLFMVLLAAFNILLYRCTGQDDILVGSPIANRNRKELEPLIGFFANTLVFRTSLTGNPRFCELLNRVNKMALLAYANQDIPFEKLVEVLQPERYMSHTPLFQVMIVLQNAPSGRMDLPGITISPLTVHNKTAKFDIWLSMSQQDGRLDGIIEYNTDIFADATITRMIKHFKTLLTGIAEAPDQSLNDLPILTVEEREQILVRWNDTGTDYPVRCLHRMFENQVHQVPQTTALIFQETHLTYSRLNQSVNQLAHHLQQLGVTTGMPVGISMERSLEMVIGIMGVLKAGGAYMPLDPEYPVERLAFMMEDARISILLTFEPLLPRLPSFNGRAVCLDLHWECISQYGKENPAANVSCQDLAYVIYTSGSTGKPKGVIIPHIGICNRLLWMQEAYALTTEDRVLQKTPFSFDVSVWEFFWPLITGAALVIARPGGHKDITYLVDIINEKKITTLHFVPSMLNVFLEEPRLSQVRSLKRVISSGEALPFRYKEQFFDRLNAELHNLYGPTEASVDVTYHACEKQPGRSVVPIGRPIANTQIYLLDRHLNPVPIGIPGEIHIGGIGLALGYLNRSELTAEKFDHNQKFLQGGPGGTVFSKRVPPGRRRHPSARGPYKRIYKTGDLAKWLPDGSIDFIDRLDTQVKVRGFRLELGEIEANLREHPAVQDAVTLAREENPGTGDKKLTAYIIPQRDYFKSMSETNLPHQQVVDWQSVFDDTYSQTDASHDPIFNIIGWNSSYTNDPIPAKEMRQWVDYTVERILSLQPGRVLEIGCGTGLLLFRVAPYCSFYKGTDISTAGLNYIRQQMQQMEQQNRETPKFQLESKSANDFEGIEAGTFNLVIMNSVVQYFPSVDYLLEVLAGAVKSVKNGGSIFIGDLRSKPLLKVFHTSAQCFGAEPTITRQQLHRRVKERMSREQELVVDPDLFIALKQRLPRIKQVEVHLKRGQYHNELTRFRYDVILRINSSDRDSPLINPSWLNWQADGLSLPLVRQRLKDEEPPFLAVTGVPNSRIANDLQTLAWLENQEDTSFNTLGQFREAAGKYRQSAVDPEAFWQLSLELPYTVDITLADCIPHGSYNVVFKHRHQSKNTGWQGIPYSMDETRAPRPWSFYGNNPLLVKMTTQLVPQVRSFLKEKLPEYMVPSKYALLDMLPLTPNGKLDRDALPEPIPVIQEPGKEFAEPITGIEKDLSSIWTQVLNLEKVSINSNFFQLGGDSINAIQVISRAKKQGIRLSLRHLYQYQNIAELAAAAETLQEEPMEAVPGTSYPTISIDKEAVYRQLEPDADIEDIYPVTPYQRHMLANYFTQHEPGLFVIQRTTSIPMPLDPGVMAQSLQKITDLHPLLRTTFVREGLDEPVQVIYKKVKAHIMQKDWSHLSPAQQEQQLEEYLSRDRERGFDPRDPVSLRVFIARTGEGLYHMALTADYMRIDGWSFTVILKHYNAFFKAILEGRQLELKASDYYKEYLAWLNTRDLAEAEKFWRNRLEEFTMPTPLVRRATWKVSPQRKGFTRQHIYISAETTAKADTFIKEQHFTLGTLITTVWGLLLSGYTREEKVVFGLFLSGRASASAEIETMIGHTINVLPFGMEISPGLPVIQVIKENWNYYVELTQFEYTALDKIHQWCQVPGKHLYETYLTLQNLPGTHQGAGAEKNAESFLAQMEYPLRVDVFPGSKLGLVMSYYRRCFADETIERMLGDFEKLLEGVITNAHQPAGELTKSIIPKEDEG